MRRMLMRPAGTAFAIDILCVWLRTIFDAVIAADKDTPRRT